MPNEFITPDEMARRLAEPMSAYLNDISADVAAHPLSPGEERLYANPFGRDLMPLRVVGTDNGSHDWFLG